MMKQFIRLISVVPLLTTLPLSAQPMWKLPTKLDQAVPTYPAFDLRAKGQSMEGIPHPMQDYGTCYAESAQQILDSKRHELDPKDKTLTDSMWIATVFAKYAKRRSDILGTRAEVKASPDMPFSFEGGDTEFALYVMSNAVKYACVRQPGASSLFKKLIGGNFNKMAELALLLDQITQLKTAVLLTENAISIRASTLAVADNTRTPLYRDPAVHYKTDKTRQLYAQVGRIIETLLSTHTVLPAGLKEKTLYLSGLDLLQEILETDCIKKPMQIKVDVIPFENHEDQTENLEKMLALYPNQPISLHVNADAIKAGLDLRGCKELSDSDPNQRFCSSNHAINLIGARTRADGTREYLLRNIGEVVDSTRDGLDTWVPASIVGRNLLRQFDVVKSIATN